MLLTRATDSVKRHCIKSNLKEGPLGLRVYSRELHNITLQQNTSNVIIGQDDRQKVAFLWKDNQFFATFNDFSCSSVIVLKLLSIDVREVKCGSLTRMDLHLCA